MVFDFQGFCYISFCLFKYIGDFLWILPWDLLPWKTTTWDFFQASKSRKSKVEYVFDFFHPPNKQANQRYPS